MHWKKLFNPNYLGAYAFETGEEKPVTISSIKEEEVTSTEGKKENCLVCTFKEPEKPLILNKTNCKTIEKLYNEPDIDQWPGKGIILYVAKVKAFGELTDAVRIRSVKPFLCSACGGIITGCKNKTHAEIYELTRKKYGKALCPACATKAAQKEEKKDTH
ncbi:MAG: hypothetical protein IKO25_09245 [Clostridia bacterium]|nr:hypothetical protein [Clostridia bacterium]